LANARQTAVKALIKVFEKGEYSDRALLSVMGSDIEPRDKAFVSALFYGVIEKAVTLDTAIASCSKLPPEKLSPQVRQILRLGFYQLMYMDSVPHNAAVNESVKLAVPFKVSSAKGYINGVMRAFIRGGMAMPKFADELSELSVSCSVPKELINLWVQDYGIEKARLIAHNSAQRPPLFARTNTLRCSKEKLISILGEEGIEAVCAQGADDAVILKNAGDISASPALAEGLFHIQDISSQRCAAALDVREGMRVLDCCCAPGGKSFTIAQMMGDKGELIASDISAERLETVKDSAKRLGIKSISVRAADAAEFNGEMGTFDRILCDAPCSGYGVIRRKPEIKYKAPETVDELPDIQYNIMNTVSRYLRPGGKLVYSTCTLRKKENEEIVDRFLKNHEDFDCPQGPVTVFTGEHGGDGFFYAVLLKRSIY